MFKRCGCRDRRSGHRLEGNCRRLGERGHGSWYFHCSVSTVLAGPERVRRGGFPSRRAAEAACAELVARSVEEATAETWTVGRWLVWWLSTRTSLRPTTLRSYTEHVQRHLIPYLGRIRLAELTGRDVAATFAALSEAPARHGGPFTPASLRRIRATLRAALNAAIREGLLRDNPDCLVELRTGRRPPAQVWTKARVEAWRERGERSTVAVWTEHQLAEFLDFVASDRLYALWWLIALHGLRRGEARRTALVGRRPRRPSRDDQPAAAGLRPQCRGRAAEDRGQPPHRHPGPDHGQRTVGAPPPAGQGARRGWPGVERHGYVFTTSDGQRCIRTT